MLSTSFPWSPWFFLQLVTMIGITSNLPSNSKEPLKYVKDSMTDPSNWRSCKLRIRKIGFPMRSQNFFGSSVTSLPVSKSKLLILTFSIMSYFFCSIFSTFLFSFFSFFFLLKRLPYWFNFLQFFQRFFFFNLHTAWKWFFFKQFIKVFTNAMYFFYFMITSTIRTFLCQ